MAEQDPNEPILRFKKVAIIASEGFEESELFQPKKALEDAGAQVTVISPQRGPIRAWSGEHWGREVVVDRLVTEASPRDFDALMLPGGVSNSDHLRNDGATVSWVTEFVKSGKPVAAICHAPWILIETGEVRDRIMTSWPSLKTDLQNAGAEWVDQEVVTDGGWVTSRKPDDIPAFNKKMIEEFREGKHQGPLKKRRPKSTDSLSLRH
jgi:protease I